MHNFRSYDGHLISSTVKPRHGDISVIPNTSEKYTSFIIGDVTFIGSFQFMPSSIESFSENQTDVQFKETMRYLKSNYGGKVSYRVAHYCSYSFFQNTFQKKHHHIETSQLISNANK